MKYVVHKRLRCIIPGGTVRLPRTVNLRRGTVLHSAPSAVLGPSPERAMLFTDDGAAVATPHSQIGREHIAINSDGRGLERGDLTHAILHAPHQGDGKGHRFTESEQEMLNTEYSHWLTPDLDVILFNDAFYHAPVEDLQELADRLHIRVKRR